MRREGVSTNGENKSNGGMSIHTGKIAIAGSLGMSKESKGLDERFLTVLLVNLHVKVY